MIWGLVKEGNFLRWREELEDKVGNERRNKINYSNH